jgi:lysophospholipase L1-like esterase
VTTAPEEPVDPRVFVEGDSLTVGMAPYLPALMGSGWDLTVDAGIGRATPAGISILAQRGSDIGATLVVALGTNDTADPAAFSSHIDQVMHIAGTRRVIWVTVARAGWERLDTALLAAQARWPNLQVIDWRPVIAAHPDMRGADGIHLTEAGYRLRARFVAAAIQSVDTWAAG